MTGYQLGVYTTLLAILSISLFLLPIRYSFERLKLYQTNLTQPYWMKKIEELCSYNYPPKKTIVMNFEHNVEAMFYTDYTVYPKMLPQEKIEELHLKKYRLIYYDRNTCNFNIYSIPDN